MELTKLCVALLVVLLHVALGLGPEDADLLGDGLGGHGVVAGNHDDLDPGGLALGDGRGHGGARRVDERHEAQEHEAAAALGVLGEAGALLVADGEVARVVLVRLARELVVGGVHGGVELALREAEAPAGMVS